MHATARRPKVALDGSVIGSELVRAADIQDVLDARKAAIAYQKMLGDMQSVIEAEIALACERATHQGIQHAVQQVIGRYAHAYEQLQNATNAVAQALVQDLASALQVVLTDEQRAQILGRLVLRELSDEPVPKLAIRVPAALEGPLQRWVAENLPVALADRIRVFANDLLPSGHMVIRADDTVFEHSLDEITRNACMNAARSVVPSLYVEKLTEEA
jgi:uncharacterized protein YukE